VQDLAGELLAAFESGSLVAEPPSTRDSGFNMASAYSVEAEVARLRTAAGHRPVGRKVGYANKAMWRVLKLESLVWAHMYDDTVRYAGTDNAVHFSLTHCSSPKIEPELVFKLKRPLLTRGLDVGAVLEAVEWMAIGFEIIDCPFPGWQFKPTDFVATLGLHKALIVGQPCPVAEPDQIASFKLRLLKNGELADEGAGKNSLRSPALCLAELAGVSPLDAGELISTGTLTSAQSIAAGETWRVEVEGLPIPALEVTFTS
jgi:2-keto-4-pentenoate hydratase